MSVKTSSKILKNSAPDPAARVRYLDKSTFRAAKKRVFARHAKLLSKLAK